MPYNDIFALKNVIFFLPLFSFYLQNYLAEFTFRMLKASFANEDSLNTNQLLPAGFLLLDALFNRLSRLFMPVSFRILSFTVHIV